MDLGFQLQCESTYIFQSHLRIMFHLFLSPTGLPIKGFSSRSESQTAKQQQKIRAGQVVLGAAGEGALTLVFVLFLVCQGNCTPHFPQTSTCLYRYSQSLVNPPPSINWLPVPTVAASATFCKTYRCTTTKQCKCAAHDLLLLLIFQESSISIRAPRVEGDGADSRIVANM